MATVNDVVLIGDAYENVNVSSSIVVGTNVVIQNKGSDSVRIIINPTQPNSSSKNGWLLAPLKSILIENESEIIWAKGLTPDATHISVQPYV